jgi:hypothetical protein
MQHLLIGLLSVSVPITTTCVLGAVDTQQLQKRGIHRHTCHITCTRLTVQNCKPGGRKAPPECIPTQPTTAPLPGLTLPDQDYCAAAGVVSDNHFVQHGYCTASSRGYDLLQVSHVRWDTLTRHLRNQGTQASTSTMNLKRNLQPAPQTANRHHTRRQKTARC